MTLTFEAVFDSTHLKAARYDSRVRVLVVEFQDGAFYGYSGVTVPEALGLVGAESAGSYFNLNLKKKPYQKLIRP